MSSVDRTRSHRELARRVLRSRGVIIRHPNELEIVPNLAVQISDVAPSLQFGVDFRVIEGNDIIFETMGEFGGRISQSPPAIEELWIPPPIQSSFDSVIKQILEFARAGYPGCLGCGGPDAEEPWDEESSRDDLKNFL